jgi:hypothetical protein
MTVSVLIADMSVSGMHWKQHWLVVAYALASGAYLTLTEPAAGGYSTFSPQPRDVRHTHQERL